MARMQLSADPEDWVWARWYFCQPGALDLDVWEAYGYQRWDTDQGQAFDGPQMLYDRRPDKSLAPLTRDRVMPPRTQVYMPARVSPFSGREKHGRDEWFADGLPVEFRSQDPTGDVCGADTWDVQTTVGVSFDVSEPGSLLVSGGAQCGGKLPVGVECLIPFGGCLEMAGGAEGGGQIAFAEGDSVVLAGGAEGGGEITFAEGDSVGLAGGAEGGGEITSEGAAPLTVVEATITPIDHATPTLVDLGADTTIGNLMVIALFNSVSGSTYVLPPGWTELSSGETPTNGWPYLIAYKVRDVGDGSTVAVAWTGVGDVQAASAVVSGTVGGVINGTVSDGSGGTLVHPGFSGVLPNSVLLWCAGGFSFQGVDTGPSGWTLSAGDPGGDREWVYTQEDFDAGDVPEIDLVATDSNDYATALVVVEPP